MEYYLETTREHRVELTETEVRELILAHVRSQVVALEGVPDRELKVEFTASCQDDLNNVEVTWTTTKIG